MLLCLPEKISMFLLWWSGNDEHPTGILAYQRVQWCRLVNERPSVGVLPFNHIGPQSHGATAVGKEDLGPSKRCGKRYRRWMRNTRRWEACSQHLPSLFLPSCGVVFFLSFFIELSTLCFPWLCQPVRGCMAEKPTAALHYLCFCST